MAPRTAGYWQHAWCDVVGTRPLGSLISSRYTLPRYTLLLDSTNVESSARRVREQRDERESKSIHVVKVGRRRVAVCVVRQLGHVVRQGTIGSRV